MKRKILDSENIKCHFFDRQSWLAGLNIMIPPSPNPCLVSEFMIFAWSDIATTRCIIDHPRTPSHDWSDNTGGCIGEVRLLDSYCFNIWSEAQNYEPTLAFVDIRSVLTRIMWKFDMKLQEDSQYWDDQKVFTLWQKPQLNIKLSPRKFEQRRKADWNWNCRYVCDKGAFFVLDVLDVLGSLSFRILRYDSKSFSRMLFAGNTILW